MFDFLKMTKIISPSDSDGGIHEIKLSDFDTVLDYEGNDIDMEHIVPGTAIKCIKDGVLSVYIVDSRINPIHSDSDDTLVVSFVRSSAFVDVYLWNSEHNKFSQEPVFTGDPNVLVTETGSDTDQILEEGDIVFIAKRGTKKPIVIPGSFDDEYGVYILAPNPTTFTGYVEEEEVESGIHNAFSKVSDTLAKLDDYEEDDDDEDEESLQFYSVFSLIIFHEEFKDKMYELVDFMNELANND